MLGLRPISPTSRSASVRGISGASLSGSMSSSQPATVSTEPGGATASAMRTPPRKVPLLLPRSTTRTPALCGVSSRWCRETSRSERPPSLSAAAPRRTPRRPTLAFVACWEPESTRTLNPYESGGAGLTMSVAICTKPLINHGLPPLVGRCKAGEGDTLMCPRGLVGAARIHARGIGAVPIIEEESIQAPRQLLAVHDQPDVPAGVEIAALPIAGSNPDLAPVDHHILGVDDARVGDETARPRRHGHQLDRHARQRLQALETLDVSAPLAPIRDHQLHRHAARQRAPARRLQVGEVGPLLGRLIGEQLNANALRRRIDHLHQARPLPQPVVGPQ